jgi:hypothetical protein
MLAAPAGFFKYQSPRRQHAPQHFKDRLAVTALRRLQRRFSNGVTTAATPFRSFGKWHRSSSAAGRDPRAGA